MKITNVEKLKELIEVYDTFLQKAEEIATRMEDYGIEANKLETYPDGRFSVCGTYYDRYDQRDYPTETFFPIEWLFLPFEEVKKQIEEKERLEKIAREESERKEKEEKARKEEEKERAEYERLKAKYEQ